MFLIVLKSKNLSFVYFTAFCLGLFFNTQWAPALEFGAEIAYPVGEANSAGALMLGGSVTAAAEGYLFTLSRWSA